MGPKKRDKQKDQPPKPELEEVQADHELFLQAFEKPTQIYRYLKTRHVISPIFLHRTLTYMRSRNSRTKRSRSDFKIDSILEKVEAKQKKDKQTHCYKSEYMSLAFTGFYDNQDNLECDNVEVEVALMKVCHKKRKDVSSPIMETNIGQVMVARNPEQTSSPQAAAVSIAAENFAQNNGHTVKSYVLLLKVHCKGTPKMANGTINGDTTSDSDEPLPKRKRGSKVATSAPLEFEYGSELVVYDKQKSCLLTDGDYEIALQDQTMRVSPKKNANWETVVSGKAGGPFDVFSSSPILKFNLSWSEKPLSGTVELPPSLIAEVEMEGMNGFDEDDDLEGITNLKLVDRSPRKKRSRIFYHFLYNNNTRQQTEAHDDVRCPWCTLNGKDLYSLLKHLRLCHARFTFTYQPHPKGARIDVAINERYDGSYVGNPQDLHSHIGYAFCRTGPVRRTPVTHVIVYRPRRPSHSLSEFIEAESEENHCSRQAVQGHNRLYYHTVTNQPILPQEFDDDSEEENDPLWLRQKTTNLIDEFTDVNEGEKELMKMWNLHIMRKNYIGDCQIPTACQTFVKEHGREILAKNIKRNFIMHMVNLFDFSLIKPEIVSLTMAQLFKIESSAF